MVLGGLYWMLHFGHVIGAGSLGACTRLRRKMQMNAVIRIGLGCMIEPGGLREIDFSGN
jgi:hypothetical protein